MIDGCHCRACQLSRQAVADEHQRYLGVLGLLGECAVYVPEDLREMIEQAMTDACAAHPTLRWRRIINRIEIEVAPC